MLSRFVTFFSTSIKRQPDNISSPQIRQSATIIDWAADEGDGLPSINSLQAAFGASRSVALEFGVAGVLMLHVEVKSRRWEVVVGRVISQPPDL